jgi:hypothetical protein
MLSGAGPPGTGPPAAIQPASDMPERKGDFQASRQAEPKAIVTPQPRAG